MGPEWNAFTMNANPGIAVGQVPVRCMDRINTDLIVLDLTLHLCKEVLVLKKLRKVLREGKLDGHALQLTEPVIAVRIIYLSSDAKIHGSVRGGSFQVWKIRPVMAGRHRL